jgi:uncharacterized protein YjbJ (UPF0337 family)
VSHAGASVGGYSVSASGVAENHPDRQAGSWNQTIGAGKEFVGGTLGLQGLKTEGQQQNEQGKAQEAAGQLKDYGTGIQERVVSIVTLISSQDVSKLTLINPGWYRRWCYRRFDW